MKPSIILLSKFRSLYFRFALPACSSHSKSTVFSEDPLLPPAFTGDITEKQYPKHVHEIVEQISKLSLLEVADLSELLQKRLNIKNTFGMMAPVMVQPQNNQATEVPEEQQSTTKTSFTVKLVKFDAGKKVQLIKEIKQILPEMNLVQAKKFVEAAPGNIKSDLSKDEAEAIKKTLEAAGGSVEIE